MKAWYGFIQSYWSQAHLPGDVSDITEALKHWGHPTGKLQDFLQGRIATEEGETTLNWKRLVLDWILEKNSLL